MAYPKPLSPKSIERKYKEAGLSAQKITFIRTFFEACVNLYGSIQACYAWDVYKELAKKADCVKLQRKDLLNAAAIMRREPNRSADFLKYADPSYGRTEQEIALRDFVGNLVVNMDEYEDPFSHTMKKCSDHKGEMLKDFSWMNSDEVFNLRYARGEYTGSKGKPKEVEYLLELYKRTEAEKIVENLIDWNHLGSMSPGDIIKYTVRELQEVGVGLNEIQMYKLIRLIFEQHNSQHLWCLEGWSPKEMGDFTEEDFLVLQPGEMLAPAYDDRVICKSEDIIK